MGLIDYRDYRKKKPEVITIWTIQNEAEWETEKNKFLMVYGAHI